MGVFVVFAIIWIITEVYKESKLGTPKDPTWREIKKYRDAINKNFPNVKW